MKRYIKLNTIKLIQMIHLKKINFFYFIFGSYIRFPCSLRKQVIIHVIEKGECVSYA